MDNKTMMQYFEWYLPEDGVHWRRCSSQAKALKKAGINMVWLPPAYKGANGNKSVGYDVYDTYDLGEFDQKGSVATKYGTKKEYLKAVKDLQAQGIQVLSDVVLNHMMGADNTENINAVESASYNREIDVSGEEQVTVWTGFTFPGRKGKYSDFTWNHNNFSGTDWDQEKKKNAIFRFAGKHWNEETDDENGNYDYLMGADLDMDNPETVKAVTDWGKWYMETVGMDGFRLDAVKHISFTFYKNWLQELRSGVGKDFFAVGEYWSRDIAKMTHYLDATDNSLSLFDVTLHFAFLRAATSDGNMDMRTLFDDSLLKARPDNAVTFVDNHDTQPNQALYSFIPEWFKPIAYAIILLRDKGIPCVFYGDYYGIPHDNVKPVQGLKKLIKIREKYAYGVQHDYFDDASVVGFTREGDEEHENSGLAVLLTDSTAGEKRMYVGKKFAGYEFVPIMGKYKESVLIDGEGFGYFKVDGGTVAVWLPKNAYEYIRIEME